MKIKCAYCGKKRDKAAGHVNRSRSIGAPLYCDKVCAGLGRRTNETAEEKKYIKSWYDGFLRVSMSEKVRRKRAKRSAELFQIDYKANPEKYREQRRKRQKSHNEYCRQPAYKKYKKEYDQKYRAKKKYGKYWEAFVALRNLQGIVDNRQAKRDQKTINKSQQRKRNASKNVERQKLESCTVGIYQQR